MAMLLENAGGQAITGAGGVDRILELLPTGPHSRSPIILGCSRDVTRVQAIKAAQAAAASSGGAGAGGK